MNAHIYTHTMAMCESQTAGGCSGWLAGSGAGVRREKKREGVYAVCGCGC